MNVGETKTVILASASAGRLAMLRGAGVLVEAIAARVDEDSLKQGLMEVGAKPRDIADALAEAKATKISRKSGDALVIGSDQILVCSDGSLLDKPESPEQAKAHLHELSGQTHDLISAVVICEAGKPVWRYIDNAHMKMRELSPEFIENYIDQYWDQIRYCVGCYRIEAEGVQLFAKITGDHFTIMGMPMLAVIDYLRIRGIVPS